jgi:uncharacterized protein (TIGR03435 family)
MAVLTSTVITFAQTRPSSRPVFEVASTAIQELGLRLEGAKAPLEVLVIDNVQHPSEN